MLDKALITRADDFGSSHSANQAIYEVSKKGIVKNVSVMACAPYLEEAAEMLASSKDVTFGMHSVINAEWDRVVWGPVAPKEKVKSLIDHRGVFYQDVINAEWDRVVWGPVAPKEKVKSLIDHRGVFYQDVLELAAAKPDLDEIITEYKYQLDRLRKVGFPIAYIDSHMMPEGDIPGLAEKFDRWVEEEGLINHRYYNRMLPDSDKFSHDRTLFEKEIRKLEGQYKLVLHPAKTSDEMKMIGNHNYSGEFIAWEREDDYEFYNDPTVLSFLQEQGVKLLSYKDAEPAKEPYNFSLWRK